MGGNGRVGPIARKLLLRLIDWARSFLLIASSSNGSPERPLSALALPAFAKLSPHLKLVLRHAGSCSMMAPWITFH